MDSTAPYRAVLFDADGMVLLPKRFSDQIREEYGIPWERMKPFFDGPFRRCKLGQADLKEELAKVAAEWGWRDSVDALVAYWLPIGAVPNPEVLAVAAELRASGVRCGLATNQEAYRAAYLRNVPALRGAFDDWFVSCEIGAQKSEAAFFRASYDRLASGLGPVPKDEILFVDHDAANLDAAGRFGFRTHAFEDVGGFRRAVLAASSDDASPS